MASAALLNTLFQLYGLMLLGFFLGRAGLLDGHTNRSLSAMVVTVIYPLMLLYSMAGQPGSRGPALALLGGGVLLYGGMVLAAEGLTWLCRVPKDRRRAFACLLTFANTGFIGAPLAQSLWGDAAFFQMTLLNFAYYLFYNTYAVLSLSGSGEEGQRRRPGWRDLFTPGFVMTLLAVALYLLRFDLPGPVKELCGLAGGMTTPLSMLILGGSLAGYPFRESVSDPWTYLYSAIKLLLFPLLAHLACGALGVEGEAARLTLLSCAMPAGSMVLMLALQLGCGSGFISRSIFVSSVLSAATLPLVSFLFLR